MRTVTWEAPGVLSLELRHPGGGELPPFTAGAHIDTHLPGEMTRSYSLINAQEERDRYVIAVARDASSRGGSAHVHDAVRPGDMLDVSGPRNDFALAEDAPATAMLAGGIGITPMVSMVRRLHVLGRPWQLTYCARTRSGAAFLDDLRTLAARSGGELRTNFDHEPGGTLLDVAGWVDAVPDGAHLYCCGPAPMLRAFEEAATQRPPSHVHLEHFGAVEAPAAEGGFTVHLARRKRDVPVRPGQTILDALLAAKVPVDYSCSEGVCGTCEVAVLEGVPDHRDVVLSQSERASNRSIMICCSGSKTQRLVLDL